MLSFLSSLGQSRGSGVRWQAASSQLSPVLFLLPLACTPAQAFIAVSFHVGRPACILVGVGLMVSVRHVLHCLVLLIVLCWHAASHVSLARQSSLFIRCIFHWACLCLQCLLSVTLQLPCLRCPASVCACIAYRYCLCLLVMACLGFDLKWLSTSMASCLLYLQGSAMPVAAQSAAAGPSQQQRSFCLHACLHSCAHIHCGFCGVLQHVCLHGCLQHCLPCWLPCDWLHFVPCCWLCCSALLLSGILSCPGFF